jgi:hypothetical protein
MMKVFILLIIIAPISLYSQNNDCELDSFGIYTNVNQEAEYWNGNIGNLHSFFIENVQFPQDKYTVPEKLKIKFIIYSDGCSIPIEINGKQLKDTTLLSSIEKEYIRVAKYVPKWIPAKCNGELVDSYAKITIILDYK